MAAKAKAQTAKVTHKPVRKVKARSGLPKMSAVQFKAYQKARQSAIQKAQFRDAVQRLQQRRLQGAAKAQAKVAAKLQQTISARIKSQSIRTTYQQNVSGHQARTLRVATARRLFQAQSVTTQHQFAYLGERIHKRTTVLQTVTTAQATQQVLAARYKAALRRAAQKQQVSPNVPRKKVGRPKKRAGGTSSAIRARRARYDALGRAAGLAAAKHASTAQAASAKKQPAKPKARKAAGHVPAMGTEWVTAGNDQAAGNCIAVALANHLLLHTGCRMSDDHVRAIDRVCDGTIEDALWWAWTGLRWDGTRVYDYEPCAPEDGAIIGFGDHAAVMVAGGQMISWGNTMPLASSIEEAWRVRWTVGDDKRSPGGPG